MGIVTPSLSLDINKEGLEDQLPKDSEWILDMVDLNKLVPPQHVSIAGAINNIGAYAWQDMDLNLVLSFVMLTVFAVAFTVLDILILCAATYTLLRAQGTGSQGESVGFAVRLTKAARVFRHLSMLDVLAMGVVISVVAGAGYQDMGIAIGVMRGLYWLIASEVVHYLVYHFVLEAVKFQEAQSPAHGEESLREASLQPTS